MTTYDAVFTQEGDVWEAELVDEPRVHTFGRTLSRAVRMLREATALWYELDVDQVDVNKRVRFADPELVKLVDQTHDAQVAEVASRLAAAEQVRTTAAVLAGAGLSLRDVAEVLDLSHQRVHQLVGH